MTKLSWQRLVEWQVKYRVILLILILIGTGFFAYKAIQLEVETDFNAMYPPSHPYIQLYNEYKDMFGSANEMIVILENKKRDIYNPETLDKLERITKSLMNMKGVNPYQIGSLSHPSVKDVSTGFSGVKVAPIMEGIDDTDAKLNLLEKRVYRNSGMRGIFVSVDDSSAAAYAGFWEEDLDLRQLHTNIQTLKNEIEDEDHRLYVTGYPMLYATVISYSPMMIIILALTFGVLLVLLIFYFRSVQGVFVPITSGVISAIWGLGFAAFLGYDLDPLVLVVPVLLSARALSHSVQAMERYLEEYYRLRDKEKAVVKAYSSLYRPAVLSIITDGLGILTIAVATIPLMQKLAFFSSFWIISIYISVVLLNPILFMFLPAPKTKAPSQGLTDVSISDSETARGGDRIYLGIARFLLFLSRSWRRPVVLGIMLAVMVGGGYLASHLKVGNTSPGAAIFFPDHPYNVASRKMSSDFSGSSQIVVIAEGKEKKAIVNEEAMSALAEMQLYMENKIESIEGTLTIADMIKRINMLFHEGYPKWSLVPSSDRNVAQILYLIGAKMAPGEMDLYISLPEYKNATVRGYLTQYDNQTIKNVISKLENFIDNHEYENFNFRLAGGIVGIQAAINEEVEWSYWVNLALIFSLTFLLCAAAYQSIVIPGILILPLIISQIACEVFMLLMGIDLNINSLPVAAIGVGIGIDYGIYVFDRIREVYWERQDIEVSKFVALTSTGKAVIFTATTLVVGVIFWILSPIKFQYEMGLLLAFLMVANFLGAVLTIPTMVSVISPRYSLGYKGKPAEA